MGKLASSTHPSLLYGVPLIVGGLALWARAERGGRVARRRGDARGGGGGGGGGVNGSACASHGWGDSNGTAGEAEGAGAESRRAPLLAAHAAQAGDGGGGIAARPQRIGVAAHS